MAAAALLMSGLTSCVYDRDEVPMGKSDGSLTITIKSDNFEVPLTRAAVDNQTDPGTVTENVLTTAQTVIAIFKSDGKLIKAAVPSVTDGKLTLSDTQTGVDWLDGASEVFVAGNLPASLCSTLAALAPGTDTKTTFAAALSLGITDALNSNSLTGSVIPMFGFGSVSNTGTNYSASVNVAHMLTKITLNSLGVDFSKSTTPNASFQPEQVFIINAPDNIGINASGAITQNAPSKWYFGEVAGSTGDGASNNTGDNHQVPSYSTTYTAIDGYGDQFNAADYLGTAALSGQTVMNAENPTWLKTATAGSQAVQQYYFYTMPNTTAADSKTQTRLVIRGAFKENSAAAAVETYYAVPLNNTGISATSLDANKNYMIDVIIKQKGAADAFAALPNDISSTMAVTYNVTSFSGQPTTIVIGNGAVTATDDIETTPKVGDYFYTDGSWSSVYDGSKTLAGIVFSTNVSATDIAAGYTHGYVMALTDAGYDYNNGSPTITKYKYRNYTAPTSGTKELGLFNIGGSTLWSDRGAYVTAWQSDMDGLSHTTTLLADANEAEYLAAHAANDYNTSHAISGTNNSGWYLPSCGQLYELAYNFGGRTAWTMAIGHDAQREGQYNEYHNWYYAGAADATTTAINTYLTARLVTAAGLTADQDYQPFIDRTTQSGNWVAYWSSSDYSAFFGLSLYFSSYGNLRFDCGNKAGEYCVLPVLAF